MEFLQGLAQAQTLGLSKDEFLKVWTLEKQVKQQPGRGTLDVPWHNVDTENQQVRVRHQNCDEHIRRLGLCQNQLTIDEQSMKALEHRLTLSLHKELDQHSQAQEHRWQTFLAKMDETTKEFTTRFDILSTQASNLAESNVDVLKLQFLKEMDLLKQDLMKVILEQGARCDSKLSVQQDPQAKLSVSIKETSIHENAAANDEGNIPTHLPRQFQQGSHSDIIYWNIFPDEHLKHQTNLQRILYHDTDKQISLQPKTEEIPGNVTSQVGDPQIPPIKHYPAEIYQFSPIQYYSGATNHWILPTPPNCPIQYFPVSAYIFPPVQLNPVTTNHIPPVQLSSWTTNSDEGSKADVKVSENVNEEGCDQQQALLNDFNAESTETSARSAVEQLCRTQYIYCPQSESPSDTTACSESNIGVNDNHNTYLDVDTTHVSVRKGENLFVISKLHFDSGIRIYLSPSIYSSGVPLQSRMEVNIQAFGALEILVHIWRGDLDDEEDGLLTVVGSGFILNVSSGKWTRVWKLNLESWKRLYPCEDESIFRATVGLKTSRRLYRDIEFKALVDRGYAENDKLILKWSLTVSQKKSSLV